MLKKENGKSDPSSVSASNTTDHANPFDDIQKAVETLKAQERTYTAEDMIQEADNLADDILQILDKNGVARNVDSKTLKSLLIDFSIYFVNRDHRILKHGIKLGKETKK